MKINKFYFLITALIICQISGYAQVFDNFSDGDFTNNPTWTGSESLFVVENEVLRSNSPGENAYFLSTPNTLIDDIQWDFFFNLAFGTSGSNFVDIYLVADDANVANAQNAYFIRIGGTPDEISFYKRSNGDNSVIID